VQELMKNVMDSYGVERGEIKTKRSRGISARACVARAMNWKLELAKDVTVHDASGNEASLPQAMCEAKQAPKQAQIIKEAGVVS
jgi:hypothetical protein